jgi:nicotinamide mononucleotide adenylyltransferase
MLDLVLEEFSHYKLLPVPDLGDGPRWREMVIDLFGKLDLFVTDNPYVFDLLKDDYRIRRPVELISVEDHIAVNGTMVRQEMAQGERWKELVPSEISDYISSKKLDERFRQEFGLETLAMQLKIIGKKG